MNIKLKRQIPHIFCRHWIIRVSEHLCPRRRLKRLCERMMGQFVCVPVCVMSVKSNVTLITGAVCFINHSRFQYRAVYAGAHLWIIELVESLSPQINFADIPRGGGPETSGTRRPSRGPHRRRWTTPSLQLTSGQPLPKSIIKFPACHHRLKLTA